MVKPVKLCHFDVVIDGDSAEKNFYEQVFDWSLEDTESNYALIRTKDTQGKPDEVIGVLWLSPKIEEFKGMIIPFLEVEDAQAICNSAAQKNGTVVKWPTEYKGYKGGKYAVIRGLKEELIFIHQKGPGS